MTSPTPQELVDQATALIAGIHATFAQAAPLAVEQLGPVCLARFRQLRRDFTAWHMQAGQFLDDCVPDTTTQSGGS